METVKEQNNMEVLKEELNRLMLIDSTFSSTPLVRAMFNPKAFGKNSEYISLAKFKEILWECTCYYVRTIQCNKNAINPYSEVNFEFSKDNKKLDIIRDEKKIMQINCEGLPKLIEGDEMVYDKIKRYLFNLIPLQNLYVNFLSSFENNFDIGEITKIKITNEYGIKYPTIILEFGNLALFEIHSQKREDSDSYEIITYSENSEINKFLQDNKEKLLKQICIPKTRIPQLLAEYRKLKH